MEVRRLCVRLHPADPALLDLTVRTAAELPPIHTGQNRRTSRIGERHTGKANLAWPLHEGRRAVGVFDFGIGSQKIHHPDCRGGGARQLGEKPAGNPQRKHQYLHEHGEGHKVADGHRSLDDTETADPKNDDRGQGRY